MLRKALTLTVLLVSSLSINAALYDRGNGMIYDDVLDITWLQDANYAHTSGYAAANANAVYNDSSNHNSYSIIGSGVASGSMAWGAAKVWAEQLIYEGYQDWRLASANLSEPCDVPGFAGCGELAHMYFYNWGGTEDKDSSFIDSATGHTSSFLNVKWNNYYHYQEEYSGLPDTHSLQIFILDGGTVAGFQYSPRNTYAWAVRDGDVAAVPVPAAAWLFGSALIGLVGLKRNKQQ